MDVDVLGLTCEFLLAAVSHTLLETVQLVFDLLVLPLSFLTLPPFDVQQYTHTHTKVTE